MRREFAIQIESDVAGYQSVRAAVRIDGPPTPGSTVAVSIRVPNIAGDNIPDKLDAWQSPKQVAVGQDGFVRVSVTKVWGSVNLRAKILALNGVEYLVGDGKGKWLGQAHTFKVTRSKRALFTDTPAPTPTPAVWKAKELKRYPMPFKIKAIVDVGSAVVLGPYDRISRVNAHVDELRAGATRRLYDGDGKSDETIGSSAIKDGTLYLQAERGANVLRYEIATGKLTRGAGLTKRYKWNVENCIWGNDVAFSADGPDDRCAIFSATTGKKLFEPVLDGFIPAICADDKNVLWMAVADAQWGVCNSNGWKSRGVKPASIACWNGTVYVGEQAGGCIYKLTGESWVKVYDTGASKINRMVVDARDGCLLVAASNPDQFLRVYPDHRVEVIARFGDQPREISGEQFDTYINQGTGTSIVASRCTQSGAIAYRFERTSGAGAPIPDVPIPDAPPTDDEVPFAGIKWFKRDFKGFRQVSQLKAAISGGKVLFNLDRPMGGTDAYAVSVMLRQGKYAGGPFDGIGAGDKTRYVKGLRNMGSDDNERKGPYWCGDDRQLRAYYKPVSGELLFVMLVDVSTKVRTNLVSVRWP